MASKLDVTELLMPKATAVWLVENTGITFEQIGAFTGLHAIEVQALADEDIGRGIVGRSPIDNGELTKEEIEKAQADPSYELKLEKRSLPAVKVRSKGPRYTPVSKRGDKPDAIAYILKHHPEISDAQITKLVGTTKPTIQRVRDRTHPNGSAIRPKHPVDLGLCSYKELEASSNKGLKAQGKDPEAIAAQKGKVLENQETKSSQPAPAPEKSDDPTAGFDFSNFLGKSASEG